MSNSKEEEEDEVEMEISDEQINKLERYHAYLNEVDSSPEHDEKIYIGKLTKAQWDEKIRIYKEKKLHRAPANKVRYACRS